jgi:hypothetical protein
MLVGSVDARRITEKRKQSSNEHGDGAYASPFLLSNAAHTPSSSVSDTVNALQIHGSDTMGPMTGSRGPSKEAS